jgi:hypothetical protein
LATVTQIRQQREPWTESENTINNQAQVNAYESLFQTLTQKKWFAGGFAWKWYADDYHKREKKVLITLRRKNLHLKPLKDGTDNLK